MVRRDLRPLDEMTETAGAIAGGDLSQRVSHVAEGTEVGQLGVAFNTMIDEIEVAFGARAASEERLRRFLADASHELRTPLTSILGYAELFELGMRDPGDLARPCDTSRTRRPGWACWSTISSCWPSSTGERPLRFEPVDLAELAHRSADAVTVVGPRPAGGRRRRGSVCRSSGTSTACARWSTIWSSTPSSTPRPRAPSRSPPGWRVGVDGADGGRTGSGPCSPSTTRDPASIRPTPPGSSNRSTGPTRRGPGRRVGPASAWPSWRPSSRPTGARSPSAGPGGHLRGAAAGPPASGRLGGRRQRGQPGVTRRPARRRPVLRSARHAAGRRSVERSRAGSLRPGCCGRAA